MTLPTNAAEPTPPSVVPDPANAVPNNAGTSSQPDWKAIADEWKARATGFQRSWQNEQTARQNLEQQAAMLTQQITGLTTERDTVKTQLTTTQEEADTAKTTLEITNAELDRVKMVATDFPQLLPLLKDEALPDGTGDELRKKLAALVTHMGGVAHQEKTEKDKGATPPAPTGGVRDAKSVYAQAMDAARKGDTALYDRLIDEYHKLNSPTQ